MLNQSNMQRLSVIHKGKLVCSAEWVDKIKRECKEIVSKATDRHFLNYTFESLDIYGHQSFDLLILQNNLAGW